MRAFVLATVGALSSGCATFGTYQTARPIDQGSLQVAVEPGMWSVGGGGALPVTNLTVRHGFGARWDLGLRAGSSGIGLGGKFALDRDANAGLAVALAPSVSAAPWGARPVHLQVPLLVGVPVGPHELTVGPRLQAWSVVQGRPPRRHRGLGLAAGVSLGGAIRLARGVRIVPEVTLVRPLLGRLETRAVFDAIEIRAGGPLYQVSLGVLLGGESGWWRRQIYPPYFGGPYGRW